MDLTLEETRIFRHSAEAVIHSLMNNCRHSNFDVVDSREGNIHRCKRCFRWWFPREPYPPPSGNPALAQFLKPCQHTRIKTLEGTTTHNRCLECDIIIEKHVTAVIWKNIRERGSDFLRSIQGTLQSTSFLPSASPILTSSHDTMSVSSRNSSVPSVTPSPIVKNEKKKDSVKSSPPMPPLTLPPSGRHRSASIFGYDPERGIYME